MSFGQSIDEDFDDLGAVKSKFVELWAKYPDRTPQEVARSAFNLCGIDPGFRFASCAVLWSESLEVLEAVNALKPVAHNAGLVVPTKEQLVAEMLDLARNPKVDAKDRATLYKTSLEALGHITKQVDKTTKAVPMVPSAIRFNKADFNRPPEEAAA